MLLSSAALLIGQEVIRRVHTGLHLAEGPAWSSLGQYAIFSDVKNDTLYRYIWETGEVTVFRRPSYSTNGNSFDFEGRQLSTQDFFRRVVRWEADGSMGILADNYNGTALNSPTILLLTKMAVSGSPIRSLAAIWQKVIPTMAKGR